MLSYMSYLILFLIESEINSSPFIIKFNCFSVVVISIMFRTQCVKRDYTTLGHSQ